MRKAVQLQLDSQNSLVIDFLPEKCAMRHYCRFQNSLGVVSAELLIFFRLSEYKRQSAPRRPHSDSSQLINMFFAYNHPDLSCPVRFMICSKGTLHAKGADIALLCGFKQVDRFCRRQGALKVKDVLDRKVRGISAIQLETWVFSWSQLENMLIWNLVEWLKLVERPNHYVRVCSDEEAPNGEETLLYVGCEKPEEAEDIVPGERYVAEFKSRMLREYETMSEMDLNLDMPGFIPAVLNVDFGDGTSIQYGML